MSLAPASLGGVPIMKGTLTIPYNGIWHADILLTEAVDVSVPGQPLIFGDIVAVATVVRAIDFSGARGVRVVGGFGGWRKTVSSKQYASPTGVPTQAIVSDAAAEVGEIPPVVAGLIPLVVGTDYIRRAEPASNVLNDVLSDRWWMSFAGAIFTTPRASIPVVTPFTAINVRGAPGIYTIAPESPADWLPGKLFVGPTVSGTINRVSHTLDPRALRTEVMIA